VHDGFANRILPNVVMTETFCGPSVCPVDTAHVVILDRGRSCGILETQIIHDETELLRPSVLGYFISTRSSLDLGFARAAAGASFPFGRPGYGAAGAECDVKCCDRQPSG
jgi:hypothetical protein